MSKRKAKIQQIMKQHGPLFTDDDGDLNYSTREHGDICNCVPGVIDMETAIGIQNHVLAEIPGVEVLVEAVDEWVYICFTLKEENNGTEN